MTLSKRILGIVILSLLALTPAWCAGPKNVLVIINDNSPTSRAIGAYYVAKRKIPAKNVCHIKCTTKEIPDDTGVYRTTIEAPVKAYLAKTGLNKTVDYLVLTKGIPLWVPRGWSVDGLLMVMDASPPLDKKIHGNNPYFAKDEHFSHKKYGIYLATRLDGYTLNDAKALVDRSLAAKPDKGSFLIDTTPRRNIEGYAIMNSAMARSHGDIVRKGFLAELDDGEGFVGGRSKLMGYFSWGSNDQAYDAKKYRSLKFSPGAIAETAVSTSARTLSRPDDPGQSLIGDLIAQGVTGVKGYVAEPTLAAIAEPKILFDRYLSGYNLAESFYMASRFIFWRDVVIGDPLCAPYAGNG